MFFIRDAFAGAMGSPRLGRGALVAPADGFSPQAMAQIRAQMPELMPSSSCPPHLPPLIPFSSYLSLLSFFPCTF